VQRDHDRELLRILRASNTKINAELKRLAARSGVGAAVRRDQLALSQQAIHREMATLWNRVGDHTAAGRAEAAAAAVRSTTGLGALRGVLPAEDIDYLLRSAEATARRGVATLEARLGLSQVPLAESVYKNTQLANGKIDEIVNSALVRGASAVELARDVQKYIRPDVRGGVSYAAMRLGRTELNNAFHAQQVQTAINEPWTTGLLWNLSGSHPRPDECNEYADEVHEKGKSAGVFSPEEIPAKPHPNCLCFTTPVTMDRDEFIKQFEAGAYDEYLGSEFPDLDFAQATVSSPKLMPKPGSEAFLAGTRDAEAVRKKLLADRYDAKGRMNEAKGWTSRRRQALENYQYRGIPYNELCRDPKAFAKTHDASDIAFYGDDLPHLDALIDANEIDHDIIVARGVMHDVSDLSEGDFFADPGYLSTSSDFQTAVSFASESRTEGALGFSNLEEYRAHVAAAKQDGWVFVTKVPKGAKAIYGDESQYEILLGRGTRQRVVEVDEEAKIIYTQVEP